MNDMPTCFVIQPFDRGPYDKRYDDVLVPAIKAAGLEPYRVDRDPATSILIEDIEDGIRRADVCLADISLDNPNVWFEAGFALASNKPVVLICNEARASKLPFDLQHRAAIFYKTDSTRDFDELHSKVTSRLTAAVRKAERITTVVSMPDVTDGLAAHELATLVATAENTNGLDELISSYAIRQDTERAGFRKVAVTLAFGSLVAKGLLAHGEVDEESSFSSGSIPGFSITTKGMDWLSRNTHLLVLREEEHQDRPVGEPISDLTDDDIPF
jgi:nucleoside 2-deoxyribosyltransferase